MQMQTICEMQKKLLKAATMRTSGQGSTTQLSIQPARYNYKLNISK